MSDLRRILTLDKFTVAFDKFVEQADKNALSNKANGSKKPFGIVDGKAKGKILIDSGYLGQTFGQGTPSATPYFNWHCVSIYYLTNENQFILGIERYRYQHIMELHPKYFKKIGNKKIDIGVFYECGKSELDYSTLYDSFINVSELVIELGL